MRLIRKFSGGFYLGYARHYYSEAEGRADTSIRHGHVLISKCPSEHQNLEIFEQGFGKDGKESRLSFWTAMLKKDENAHFAEKLCKAGLNLDEVPFHATQLYRRFNDKLHKVALMDFEDVKEIMIIGNFSPEQKILFTCMAKNFSLSASFKAVEGGDMLVEIVKQHDNSASH